MQNVGNPYDYLLPYRQSTLGNISLEELVPPATYQTAQTLPVDIERIKAYQDSLRNPIPQSPNMMGGDGNNIYSEYGVNYDVNGDGKVGIFEGMTLGGALNNALSGMKEAATGLVHAGTHPLETWQGINEWANERYYGEGDGKWYKVAGLGLVDATDAILHPWALDSKTRNEHLGNIIGSWQAGDKQAAKEYARDYLAVMTHRPYEQAFYAGLDLVAPVAGKALKGVTKSGKAATKAQNVLSTQTSKIARDMEKQISAGEKVVKVTRSNSNDLAKAIEAAETGRGWENLTPEVKSALREYSNVTDDIVKKYSPSTHVNSEELSIIQKYARDNNTTYQQAERIVKPILDETKKADGAVIQNKGYHYSPETNITKFSDDFGKSFSGAAEHGEGLYVSTVENTAKNYTKVFDEQAGKAGKLYEVALPEEELLIKESQPFSTQSPQVQETLTKLGKGNKALSSAIVEDAIGKDLYSAVSKDAKQASKLLEENGIKGIKYYEGTPSEGVTIFKPSRNATIIKEGVASTKRLEELAKTDNIAKQVLESKKLFEKGDIFPVTHGLAEVDKAGANVVDNIGRIMAGRFSTRAFGNATYENIAKQIKNPNDYINQLSKNYLDENVKKVLLDGGSADISIAPVKPDDAMFIPRALVEDSSKSLSDVLNGASKQRLLPDDIAIDKDFLKTFKDQYIYQQTANPYGRTPLGDLYNIRKSTALASGGYLVGNLQTGVANAVINSNAGLISDVINATLTKGKLAKELGIFRRDTIKNSNVTKAGKAVQEFNLRTGGYLLSKADTKMQNMFAEIAAHAQLRKQGIKPSARLSAIDAMEGQKLGEFINDVKLISLINPTKTITPAGLHGVGGIFNPFWKWVDTAAQSSLYMLKNHPVLANAVLFDVLARSSYDKEMQNRLGIGVELDKPFVSYKVNPKTGEPREMSMEYLPQMNTLKFSAEMVDVIKGKENIDNVVQASVPLFGAALMAMKGLNKYGKPMYRAHSSMMDSISVIDGKRYRLNPNTGLPEPLQGQADEVISALANETIGSLSLMNKTVLPSVAWGLSKATGKDYDYYLPYGQALFGAIGEKGKAPTESIPFLMSGDPTRPRGSQEISNMLMGVYENAYYPSSRLEQGIYNPRMLRNFYRGMNRRDLREAQILGGREE